MQFTQCLIPSLKLESQSRNLVRRQEQPNQRKIFVAIMTHYFPIRPLLIAISCVPLAFADFCHAQVQVEASNKPGGEWRARATKSIADLPTGPADEGLDRFGGIPSKGVQASGFFRTEKIADRWWLITPAGGYFLSRGMNSVSQIATKGGKEALAKRFGSSGEWGSKTLDFLRTNGFNTLGAWADSSTLQNPKSPIAETILWSFMSSYGKARGGTHVEPGHTGYPNDCPFIFDPAFKTFCDQYAQRLDIIKDNPRVLGHFSDNELPWSLKMLENYLSLPGTDPGHMAASEWLEARRTGGAAQASVITASDRAAFLEFAIDHYLSITGAAVRKHAPHHLFLGPRLHGEAIRLPVVFAALGKHVDVVCVNYYHAWGPDAKLLEMWNRESGKPVMITEFYAKAENSGMANTGGAGWLVRTQQDRGLFYQNFTLGLIASKVCVGWSWHRYADNDPDDKKVDPSNRDSNKGILNNRYEPYQELLDSMRAVNLRSHGLAKHFDSQKP